jgi:PAS domain S-box-containing protein
MTKRRPSIRSQLLVLVLGSMLPLLGLVGLSFFLSARNARDEALHTSQRFARLAASRVQSDLAEGRSVLRSVSRRPQVLAPDSRHCDPVFEDFHSLHPRFSNLLLTTPGGTVLCSAVPDRETRPAPPALVDCLERARRTGHAAISEPFTEKATGRRVILLAEPVRDAGGRHIVTLGLSIALEPWQSALASVALPGNGTIVLMDGAGKVVLRVPEAPGWVGRGGRGRETVALALRGAEGSGEARGLDGVKRLYGFTTIPDAGWRILAGIPTSVALAPYRGQALLFAVACLCLLALAAGFALGTGRGIERPIRALTATVVEVAQGRLDARAPAQGAEEIAEVAAQFNRMLGEQARAAGEQRDLLARTVEAQREAAAARGRLAEVLERVSDGFVALDRDWRCTYMNEKAAEIFGRVGHDLVGKRIWTEFPEGVGQEFYKVYHRAMEQQVPISLEEYYPPWDRWYENRIYPSANGLSIFFHEITERKQAEDRERQLQARLNRAETMSTLGSLVAGVAHEVRNPLFGISSTLDAFEARFGDQADHARYLKVLREETDQLNRLMKDLLEYGRPQTPTFAAVPLRPLAAEVARACGPVAIARGITIENRVPEGLPSLHADQDLVFLALKNLVENAAQHSPRGACVVLEGAEVHEQGEHWIRCDVSDSGPGFLEVDLPKIFEPFFSRRAGGTGLGLSIVQRIVEEHGGEIVAGNRAEGGAIFSLKLRSAGG